MFITSLLFNLINGFVLLLNDSSINKKNNIIAHAFQKWHNWNKFLEKKNIKYFLELFGSLKKKLFMLKDIIGQKE